LEALEIERKARSEAEQEMVTLRGQVLRAEESNARLLKKVTQQEEGLSILESTHLGMYLFHIWLMSWFFLSFAFELVILFLELGGKIGSLEREWETAKAALQKSLEALEIERKARSVADREVLELRGQVLGVEESNARLLEKVTQQEEGLSILESAHLGMDLFCLW